MTDQKADCISIIDISSLEHGDHYQVRPVDNEIARAMTLHGSFVAVGVTEISAFDRQMKRLMQVFDLDDQTKLKSATCRFVKDNQNIYRGYYPRMTWEDATKEMFDIGPEPPMSVPDNKAARSFSEPNTWPESTPYDGWRNEMQSTMQSLRSSGVKILASLARGLGIDVDTMLEPCIGRNATFRLIHYDLPKTEMHPDVGLSGQSGKLNILVSEHVDIGLLSLLWQDQTGGLQMQGPDSQWRQTPVTVNGLSVHASDLLSSLTNNQVRGTPHRVLSGTSERYSAGLFVEPEFTRVITTPAGQDMTYSAHLSGEFPGRFELDSQIALNA